MSGSRSASIRLATDDLDAARAKFEALGNTGDRVLGNIAQAGQRAAAALSGVADAGDSYSRRAADIAAYGTALDNLRARVDPLFAASKRYEAVLSQIAEAERLGAINAATAARVRDEATRSFSAATSPISAVANATTALGVRTGATAMAMRNLGIQSIDVFQQLASGAPIMMTLIQQGGQVGQIAAVTGTSLGAMAKEVGAVALRFAPWIAATATVAGLGVAIYSVMQRSADLDGQQRALSVAIRGVGRDAELSSGHLQGYVTALKQQGVAAADAVKSIAELTRNSGLSAGMIGRVAGVAPDAAAALGQGVPETMRMLAEAAKGTGASIQALDDAFNLLTATEAAQVRTMLDHGDKAGALAAVFDKLEARVNGLDRDALTPAGQAFRDLGNAWDGFMDRVAKSAPVMAMINGLGATLRGISAVIDGPAQTPVETIDARIAALSGTIPGTNATAARLRRDQAEALARLSQERAGLMQSAADAAEAGFGAPPALQVVPGLTPSSDAAAKELDRIAATRAAGSDAGRMAALTREAESYRAALAQLAPGTAEYAARSGTLNAALAATNKEIEDLNKRGETHRTGLEKTLDTYAAQTRAAEELARAYSVNREEVARVLATREAEQKILGDIAPGEAKYAAAVTIATEAILNKQRAEAGAKVEELIRDTNELTDSTLRMAAAYDGTEGSIRRVREEEAARATVIKSGLTPGLDAHAGAVERLAKAYANSSDATRQFQQAQDSVRSITDSLGTAMDRLGQGMVDAFLSGSGHAVNFGNIVRSVVASIVTDLAKLALVNPLKNTLFGTASPTLGAALGAAGGGGGGGLLSGLGNALSLGRIGDALGFTNFGGQLSSFGEWAGLTGQGGLFSGIGEGISSLLATGINGVGLSSATNSALAAMGGLYGPATPSAVLGAQGGATIGGLLGGVGLGFGAGSLAGGFLQSALGRTGPAPTIGAGVGALGGTLIGSLFGGPLIGGLIGGLLGGGGGGFIGPGKKNPFSATGVTLGEDGLLSAGMTFSQLVDTSAEVSRLNQQVAGINQFLSANELRVANTSSKDEYGQTRIIGAGSNTWMNIGQSSGASADLFSAFNELRFSAANDDRLNGLLSGRSFSGPDQLADFTAFVRDTMPAMEKAPVSEYVTILKALNDVYDAAIAKAKEYTAAEGGLVAERDRRVADINARRDLQSSGITAGLQVRYLNATGAAEEAGLLAFDTSAAQQRMQMTDQILALGLDGTEYAAERLVQIERTLAAERLAIQEGYAEQSRQAARQAGSVLSGLAFGGLSPLAPEQKYFASLTALNQARQALDAGGSVADFAAVAQQVLPVARDFLGTTERYATIVADVASAVASKGGDPAGLSVLLQAQVDGTDALRDAFARYGDQQVSVASATLSEIKRLASAIEALMARKVAA